MGASNLASNFFSIWCICDIVESLLIFQLNMSIVLERKIMNQSSITESTFLGCLSSLPTCMQPPLIWFVPSVEHGQLCKSWHWIGCHTHRAKEAFKAPYQATSHNQMACMDTKGTESMDPSDEKKKIVAAGHHLF